MANKKVVVKKTVTEEKPAEEIKETGIDDIIVPDDYVADVVEEREENEPDADEGETLDTIDEQAKPNIEVKEEPVVPVDGKEATITKLDMMKYVMNLATKGYTIKDTAIRTGLAFGIDEKTVQNLYTTSKTHEELLGNVLKTWA